jgi:type I restriction enzyme M protein
MAAFMLGLWRAQGKVRTHPEYIVGDINRACEKAFEGAGKFEIAKTIHLPEENEALQHRAAQICYILRLLNITPLTSAHDYLGQLYETFFRFTGGNTIGQYFTPRHISSFMADLCEVSREDRVLDPTCGTGGFLIASLYRMIEGINPTKKELSALVKEHLLGYETEPITAALCVANMILRGDGATGIIKGDSLTARDFPKKSMTIVLGNPPFPHKSTDHPPEEFVDRGLEALVTRGKLAMLVPSATLSKKDKKAWRTRILKQHTLKAVIKVPDELFQPFASSYADILVLEKGVPHKADSEVFFCYIQDDGFKLKKGVRIKKGEGNLPKALKAFRAHKSIPGLCVFSRLKQLDKGGAWGPGSYVEAVTPEFDEIMNEITTLIRDQISFQVRFADKIQTMQELIEDGRLQPKPYSKLTTRRPESYASKKRNSLGSLFDIYYGQKALHSKENLAGGESLIISSKGRDNGCFGFRAFADVIEPPFVTAPGTGSIGEASVQLLPCGVSDDCVLLFPRPGTAIEELWIAAATIRRERWRFHYGFKLTPERIKDYVIPRSPELVMAIRDYVQRAMPQMRRLSGALASYSDSSSRAMDESQLFSELRDKWHEETRLLPNATKRAINRHYQRIIGMGEAALPLILNDLSTNGTDDWFWALTSITGENPITEDIAGNMQAMAMSWIKWGKAAGYLSDSHQRTSKSLEDLPRLDIE